MAFQGFLKQNTAIDILLGPFLDDTDGKTAETGLTISQSDVKLSKNGQALAQKNESSAAAHDANGYYNCPLNATDTNTVGQLTLTCHESGALPIRLDYHVVEEAVYDAMYGASAAGPMQSTVPGRTADLTVGGCIGIDWGNIENKDAAVDLGNTEIYGVDVAASTGSIVGNVGGDVVGSVGGDVVGNVDGNVVGSVGSVTGSVGSVATGGIASASFAADAISASALALAAANKIRDAVIAASIDGITFESAMEILLAGLAGVTVVSGNDVVFYKRDGTTAKITITYTSTDGERSASTVNN
jgi:hypothetical protein